MYVHFKNILVFVLAMKLYRKLLTKFVDIRYCIQLKILKKKTRIRNGLETANPYVYKWIMIRSSRTLNVYLGGNLVFAGNRSSLTVSSSPNCLPLFLLALEGRTSLLSGTGFLSPVGIWFLAGPSWALVIYKHGNIYWLFFL